MEKLNLKSFSNSDINFAWRNRSIWSKNLDVNYNLTSVSQFVLNNLEMFKKVKSVNTLFTESDKYTKKYVEWSVTNLKNEGIHVNTSEEEKLDLANFYKGYIGEFFYLNVFLNYNCTKFVKSANGGLSPESFDVVLPSGVLNKPDKGMDGMFMNGRCENGVIQVKFHNPKEELSNPITKDIIDKAQRDGQRHKIISQDDTYYNTLICKTGHLFPTVIRGDEFMSKEVMVMDSDTVDKSLKFNNSEQYFWKVYLPEMFSIDFNKLQGNHS